VNLSGVNGNVIISGWKDDNPDHETGKTVLRDYINATVGFDKLAAVTKKSSKRLMRKAILKLAISSRSSPIYKKRRVCV